VFIFALNFSAKKYKVSIATTTYFYTPLVLLLMNIKTFK